MPDPDPQSPDTPWSLTASRVVERLEVDAATGLDPGEVERRRESFGENRLQEAARRGLWAILWEQLRSLIMLLLVAAVGVSLLFGEVVEALAIGVVIVLNTAIGFITEWRAVRSMEALQEMGQSESLVRRGGEQSSIPAAQLVPGDIVLLQQGGVITADLRILEVDNLQVDESALTGESVPVPKQVEPVEEEAGPGDRSCMAFRGTAVTRGWSRKGRMAWRRTGTPASSRKGFRAPPILRPEPAAGRTTPTSPSSMPNPGPPPPAAD